MLKNPATLKKAMEEVDSVIGKASVQVHHLKKLKYVNAVLRETLRLTPTAPAITKKVNPKIAHEHVSLGDGRYKVEPNDAIVILLARIMQDPEMFGDDAMEFKPERMLDEAFDRLPSSAWKVRV